MKKFYVLVALFAAFSSASFAQRNIDLSVSEILSPIEIFSIEASGTALPVHLVLKNNGADEAKMGDSIFFQVSLLTKTNAVLDAIPNGALNLGGVLSRNVPNGDTIHFTKYVQSLKYLYNTTEVNFAALVILINRGSNPLTAEIAPGLTNNRMTKSVLWWNAYKNGVGVNNMSTSILNVYPNPALNQVNISWPIASTGAAATITVTDLQGKVVLSSEMTNFSGTETLNVSSLKSGMYMVEVATGDVKMNQKLQIVK